MNPLIVAVVAAILQLAPGEQEAVPAESDVELDVVSQGRPSLQFSRALLDMYDTSKSRSYGDIVAFRELPEIPNIEPISYSPFGSSKGGSDALWKLFVDDDGHVSPVAVLVAVAIVLLILLGGFWLKRRREGQNRRSGGQEQ